MTATRRMILTVPKLISQACREAGWEQVSAAERDDYEAVERWAKVERGLYDLFREAIRIKAGK